MYGGMDTVQRNSETQEVSILLQYSMFKTIRYPYLIESKVLKLQKNKTDLQSDFEPHAE